MKQTKQTKLDTIIKLLKRNTGATIGELVKATKWQPHSVRGAISGHLKKKLGLKVDSTAVVPRGTAGRASYGSARYLPCRARAQAADSRTAGVGPQVPAADF